MEAFPIWDFEAGQPDEMSFRKGDHLCVLDTEEKEWSLAVCGNQCGLIPVTYVQLEQTSWFLGSLSRAKASNYLLIKGRCGDYIYPDGAFLIRKSESDKNGFALSVKHDNQVQHFKILKDSNNKFYIWPHALFTSINQLVASYYHDNVAGEQSKSVIHLVDAELYEAAYDFTPANREELELKRGDVIRLLSKTDENWWEGYSNGSNGFFPQNYVKPFINRHF